MTVRGRTFIFGRKNGEIIGKVILSWDGTIKGYTNPNECFWNYDEDTGFLDFLNHKRVVTTRFQLDGDIWKGDFRGSKGFHILKLVIEDEPVVKEELSRTSFVALNKVGVDITDLCNLSCSKCDHASPYFKENTYNIDDYKEDVRLLSKYTKVQSFRLLGGEPLLIKGKLLEEYVRIAREAGFCSNIEILTNGTLLPTLNDYEFLNSIDVLRISYYPTPKVKALDEWLLENQKKYSCRICVEKVAFFSSGFSLNKLSFKDSKENWSECTMKKDCNHMRKGKFYLCTRPIKLPLLMQRRSSRITENLDEGIDLNKITDPVELGNEIDVFLKAKPYKMCHYCDYTNKIAHCQEKVDRVL